MRERQQNSTAHPISWLMVSNSDHFTPAYGLTPTVAISKDAGNTWVTPSGAVTELSIATPTGLAVVPNGTTGSTTYGYRVSAVNPVGETLACAEVQIANGNATLSGTNFNALSWTAVTGASSYNVYGRTAGGELKLTNVGTTSYNDTGAATPSGALPIMNTTSAGRYALAGNATDRNTLGACLIHATATGADPADFDFVVTGYDPFDPFGLGLGINSAATPFVVSNDSAATTTSFTVNTTGSPKVKNTAGYYSTPTQFIAFNSGANAGKCVKIAASGHAVAGAVSTFTIAAADALPGAPSVGDTGFIIAGG